ncbi:MAG: ABC-F family ATP-binding cassette domain-containing protein [Vicingaceae bacterium]
MLSISNLSLHFADRALFDNISFMVNPKDRIGLVGRNGAGKTTLLKTIAGIQQPDAGEISKPNGFTIGYLPQDMDFKNDKTVLEETKSVFANIHSIEAEIESINVQLSERTDYESDSYLELLNHLNDLHEKLQLNDAYSIDANAEQILKGLGFLPTDFDRPTSEFSGGWRMRIELAKILLSKSDVLLLDEPTNHLDIESIQWLEDFLKVYDGALILISHDRAFFDNVTNRTIEISLGKIYDYKAPYSKYKELRKERREHQLAAYNNQQKMIKDTEKFIERFRAKATKAVQVQSRIKQLEKIERITIDEEDNVSMKFYFPPAPHSGKVTLKAENIAKSYGNHLVFKDVNFTIERGQKVAFVGKNGEGKTTMSKIINNEIAYEGKITLGHQVKLSYFAQNQSDVLDKEKTVLETIDEVAVGEIRKHIRTLLGAFMFSGDEVDKKIKVLSGGERARVALCKLLLEPVNLLILDEPTNHLDILSKEVLKEALKKYDGTLILISHDRDFLDGLTDRIFEFTNKNVKEFYGDVYDFLKSKKADTFKAFEQEKQSNPNTINKKVSSQKTPSSDKELKKIKRKIENLEQKIAQLENEIELINQELMNPEKFSNELMEQLSEKNNTLQNTMEEWELLNIKLEKLSL